MFVTFCQPDYYLNPIIFMSGKLNLSMSAASFINGLSIVNVTMDEILSNLLLNKKKCSY